MFAFKYFIYGQLLIRTCSLQQINSSNKLYAKEGVRQGGFHFKLCGFTITVSDNKTCNIHNKTIYYYREQHT